MNIVIIIISESRALFMGSASTEFGKINFKTKSYYDTIYSFKNYFATFFFSFQFSAISGIQTDHKWKEYQQVYIMQLVSQERCIRPFVLQIVCI